MDVLLLLHTDCMRQLSYGWTVAPHHHPPTGAEQGSGGRRAWEQLSLKLRKRNVPWRVARLAFPDKTLGV